MPGRSRFFFFNDTATTEIYTLSLHDALPISFRGGARPPVRRRSPRGDGDAKRVPCRLRRSARDEPRSEEHTSELQSRLHLVCRLLLEKKKPHQRVTPSRPTISPSRTAAHAHT